MKTTEFPLSVVDMAWQVIDMQKRIDLQSHELEHLRGIEKKYFDLMNESIEHSRLMMGNVLMLAMKTGTETALVETE